MRAAFVRYKWENDAHTIATFYFRPQGTYRYLAGQYAILSLPHAPADARGYQRTMTMSSSPDDELLAFTMKIYPQGSSFKRALFGLQPGDTINIFDSLGDLVLPLSAETPLVFVAGGVGIASFTGMTSWLVKHKDARDIQLHYVVAKPGDIVLQWQFDAYDKVFPGSLTRAIYTPDVKRLTAASILQAAKPDSIFYLSGTEKLVEELRQGLMDNGVQRGQIVFDFFDGYSEL